MSDPNIALDLPVKPADPVQAYSRRRWLVVAVLFLAVIAAFFDRISVAVLFTDVDFQNAAGTGFDPTRLSLLMTVFIFAYGVSGVLLSFMGDLYGPRRCLAVGTVVWGVSVALMGAATGLANMLICRLLLGIAEGPQFSLTNSVVKRWFPPKEQARANSIWMMGSPLGSAIGFPVIICIVSNFGWRIAFYVLAAFNLLVVLPAILLIIRDRPPGLHRAEPQAFPSKSGSYLANVGSFLRDKRFWLLVIFNSAALIYLWGLNSWLPSYLVKARHLNPYQTGIFSSLPFLFMFLGEVTGATVSDMIGRRAIVCFLALLLAGVGMYLVSIIPNAEGAGWMIAASAFCWGCGLPPLFALGAQIIPARSLHAGVGAYNGIGNIVGAFSPLIMGLLISRTGAFDAGIMFLVGAAALGSLAMLPLLRRY
ncbi:MAG: MFS transporter [Methylocella sp.]